MRTSMTTNILICAAFVHCTGKSLINPDGFQSKCAVISVGQYNNESKDFQHRVEPHGDYDLGALKNWQGRLQVKYFFREPREDYMRETWYADCPNYVSERQFQMQIDDKLQDSGFEVVAKFDPKIQKSQTLKFRALLQSWLKSAATTENSHKTEDCRIVEVTPNIQKMEYFEGTSKKITARINLYQQSPEDLVFSQYEIRNASKQNVKLNLLFDTVEFKTKNGAIAKLNIKDFQPINEYPDKVLPEESFAHTFQIDKDPRDISEFAFNISSLGRIRMKRKSEIRHDGTYALTISHTCN